MLVVFFVPGRHRELPIRLNAAHSTMVTLLHEWNGFHRVHISSSKIIEQFASDFYRQTLHIFK